MSEAGARPGLVASAARWGLALGSSALGLGAAVITHPASPALAHRILKATAAIGQRIFGLEVVLDDRNHGAYDDPPYVIVHLNQTSLIENFLHAWSAPIPYRIIVNIEFLLLPIFGWANLGLGSRVVVRQRPKQAKRVIRRAIDDLRRGESYLIAIEGRRSPDGALQPYKKGAAVMAIEAQATILPYMTIGAHERLPVGEWRVRPGRVDAILLEAIPTRGLTYDDRDALLARLRALAERELAAHRAASSGR